MYSEYWDKFSKTGNIFDYLNYTACTLESSTESDLENNEEGGLGVNSYTNRDSNSYHANR